MDATSASMYSATPPAGVTVRAWGCGQASVYRVLEAQKRRRRPLARKLLRTNQIGNVNELQQYLPKQLRTVIDHLPTWLERPGAARQSESALRKSASQLCL
jgi:hypothetical protein